MKEEKVLPILKSSLNFTCIGLYKQLSDLS